MMNGGVFEKLIGHNLLRILKLKLHPGKGIHTAVSSTETGVAKRRS